MMEILAIHSLHERGMRRASQKRLRGKKKHQGFFDPDEL